MASTRGTEKVENERDVHKIAQRKVLGANPDPKRAFLPPPLLSGGGEPAVDLSLVAESTLSGLPI